MEATSITSLLKGFCDHTRWKYAVFWKLNHHFPMVVGKVALARDHCWVSCEDILTPKFETDLITECPDEWLLQIACGIKTIVFVPVLPLGVLQFGSFEEVAEDLEFVTTVKGKLQSIDSMEANITPLSMGTDYQDWSDLMHNLMNSLDESSSVTKTIWKSEVSTSTASNSANGSTRLNPTMLSFIQDDCSVSRQNLLKSLKRENVNEIGSSSFDMSTVPRHISKMETKPNHMEAETWSWSVFEEMSNGLDSLSVKNMTEKQFGGTESGYYDAKNINDFTFPSESELHKALGSVAYSVGEAYRTSCLITNKKESDHFKGFEFPEDLDPEYLLDAVVGNLCSAADDTSSISNSIRSFTTLPTEISGSIPNNYSEESYTLIVDNSDVKNDLVPTVSFKRKYEFSNHFTSSFDGNGSLLIDEVPQEKEDGHMLPISGPKLSSTNKKRTRVANNQKARPRDRQLIMDRMKELRELVPDGGRCSIDNLLERTIKHMLYLRKITSQAEKLKRFANRTVGESKRQKMNGSHPGRSCAFDFESELAWPIVIEDLECTGHMLIEMICNEHGLFLEIAQVIRKLDVTILKGILENRSSDSWACFIVEVPRGFHRMDVLCPLLHLLQLRRNPISYKS
ncbi:transcription factor bHLH155-like isoform X2 [Vigna umbellata]|uniref:transcription factor bHLH155-like isoform X2 n=1 Tax=Vigna umbellata TaxID=87088 RepID=UPI001F5F0083|nr:transcription factor bHLH155-like isoform X2 [Vigna umbellata]